MKSLRIAVLVLLIFGALLTFSEAVEDDDSDIAAMALATKGDHMKDVIKKPVRKCR
jgi:hypothetical protein